MEMKVNQVLATVSVAILLSLQAQAFTLVGPSAKGTRIVVGATEPESVVLAASDLVGDVAKITGVTLPIVRGNAAKSGDVLIATESRDAWEAYEVVEHDGVLRMTGSDVRGTMFAVYDFIERYLGVDPMHFWSGVPYPKKATLSWEKVEIHQSSPTLRFRGWFINDEDLLTAWRPGSGTRDYSDYPYYHDVVNHDTIRAIAEAAVRSRMNLIIPASLLNIMNPAERGIVEICAKRGLFVSMHHIEPMGVSGFAFEGYWKQRGEKREYSYFRYRDDVEKMWRDYAAEWAKFPNVIWQIGLRGKGDRAMWITDPTMPKDDAGRAKLISNALYRQLQILDEVGVPRKNRYVTTTLWAEGAVFYEKGLLKIPDGTTIVFADNNCGWRWQNDLMNGHRQDGVNYGVYYHHQLIGSGPHLVSLVPAAKTAEMLRMARGKGAGAYAIFNVGNIREFAYGIDATSKMTWNLDAFDAVKWTRHWLERRVPSAVDAWQSAVDAHYSALKLYPDTGVPCFLDGLMKSQCLTRLGRIASRINGKKIKDDGRWRKGDAFWKSLWDTHPILGSTEETVAWLEQQRKGFASAVASGEAAYAKTAAGEREFAADLLLYPSRVMLQMTLAEIAIFKAEDAYAKGDAAECRRLLMDARADFEKAITAGKAYCHGKWSDWYRDCRKVSIVALRDRVDSVLNRLAVGRASEDVTVGIDGSVRFSIAGGFTARPLINYRNWGSSITSSMSSKDLRRYEMLGGGKKFGEGAWTVLRQADGSVLATNRFLLAEDVTAQACGTRIYLPYDNWTGCVWRVDGGKIHTFPLDRKRAALFNGKSVSKVELTRGSETIVFTFPKPRVVHISNDTAWCDAFSLRLQQAGNFKKGDVVETVFKVERRIFTCGKGVPALASLTCGYAKPTVAKRGKDWIPMTLKRDIVPGGATDFSGWHLANGPAGRFGWLKRVGDHFEFEKRPGEAVRFYGVNLVSSCCWPDRKEDADEMVARLVRSGYNTVRLHHFECKGGIATTAEDPSSTTFSKKRIDQMDYLVSRLIAAGIYVTIDLYSYRTATWRSLGFDRDGSPTFQEMKPLILLTQAGFENWRSYAGNLMNHVNPYTGRAYKDEPGIPLVSLVNEDKLEMAWKVTSGLDCMKQVFKCDTSATTPRQIPNFASISAAVMERSAERMVTYLRSIGTKALVTDLNNGPWTSEYKAMRERWFDFDDNHFYVDHPNWLGVRLRLPYKNHNLNYFDYNGKSPLENAVRCQPTGRPYTITEWNFSGPAEYRHQGGLLTGVAASRNGWDGLWAFTWAHGINNLFDRSSKQGIGNFDIMLDPIQQANERAMVALYLRGDAALNGSAFTINSADKSFTVDTPCTQGGFALSGNGFATSRLSARLTGADAAVWATSVDGTPLETSKRILVTHATDVQNEGMEWANEKRTIILKRGARQLLARRGVAEISMRVASGDWRCYALATDGSRQGEVKCVVRDGRLRLTADTAITPADATMLYELVRLPL